MNNEESKNRIGQDFNLWGLIKFTFPSILMQMFSQLFQTLDDGLFVSRYAGETALAGINLMSPINSLRTGLVSLFSLGASTIAAEYMGKGEQQEAKRVFSRIVISAGTFGIIFGALCYFLATPIAYALGADETTIEYALIYMKIVFGLTPIHILSIVVTSFYSTSGRPDMGMYCSIINGAMNIILDVILIPVLGMGIIGSSLSTVLGDFAVLLVGLVFFMNKKHEIHFVNPCGKIMDTSLKSFKYGASSCVNSLSFGAFNLFTNKVILSIAGANGIAANAIVSDCRRILNSAITGYSACVRPIIAFNVGSENNKRLKKICQYNFTYWLIASIGVTAIGELLRPYLIGIFFTEASSSEVYALTYQGLTIEFLAITFITGCLTLNSTFIGMGEIKVSSFVSTMRNIVFRTVFTLILPIWFGMAGVWWAFPVGEVFSFALSVYFFFKVSERFGIYPKDMKLKFD